MKTFNVFIKEMPKPVSFGLVYLGCLVSYNGVASYNDATRHLAMFRSGTLHAGPSIRSEWDAVKYGATVNSAQRFWDSLVWPVTVVENIIPWIALALNPPPKGDSAKPA